MSFTNEISDRDRLHQDNYVGENDIQYHAGNGIAGKLDLTLNYKNEFFGGETQSTATYQYKIFFDARTFVLRYNFYFSRANGDISKFYVLNEKKTPNVIKIFRLVN